MTVIDDPAVLDSDPGRQVVGLAEPVVIAQLLEIARLQAVRRRLVVVTDPRSNGIFGSPWIASGGIQEMAVMDDSMRMRPSQLTWLR